MTADVIAPQRRIGSLEVSPIGLGCMNLSHVYQPLPTPDEAELLLRTALDEGVDHLDTAALYGFGANEELVGRVLDGSGRRDDVVLASKCGMTGVNGKRVIDGRPETLRATAEQALRSLRTDVIDLYYLHRVDPNVPIEESVGALADLVAQGHVREIGLSEASAATVRRAHAVHPIAALQNEFSLWTRNPELGTLDACRDRGITLVAFSPLGRGMLTSTPPDLAALPEGDLRHGMPRFQGDNYAANLLLVARLGDLAEHAGCTTAQLALAWLLAQDECVVAIPGTRRVDHLRENLAAATVDVPQDVLAAAGELINERSVHGPRYGAGAAADLDTEAFAQAG